jgi:hypothetical protein
MRTLGWTNKDNPRERFYIQFAKQAWEVADMAEAPFKSLKSKSSMAVKVAVEQIFDIDTMGRKTPFAGDAFLPSIFTSDEEGFMGSRIGMVANKFTPMTLTTFFNRGDQVPSFIAPGSKGMTTSKTIRAMTETLTAYADPGFWEQITGTPDYEARLDRLVPEIVDAALRNGVPVKAALDSAKSQVLGKYYADFWRAMNREDQEGLESAAESLVRMHAALKGFQEAMTSRYGKVGQQITPAGKSLVQQYYTWATREVTKRERHDSFMNMVARLRSESPGTMPVDQIRSQLPETARGYRLDLAR